jgi:hypothetical protein
MAAYHRTDDLEKIRKEMPLALFEIADWETMKGWPKSMFVLAELEFAEITKGTEGIQEAWEEKTSKELTIEVLEGENHVGYVYGIGTEGNVMSRKLLDIVRGLNQSENKRILCSWTNLSPIHDEFSSIR